MTYIPQAWEQVNDTQEYTDYDQWLDVGDEWVFCNLRATWDHHTGEGYVSLYATTDGGARELMQCDFPKRLTRAEFTALTGYQFAMQGAAA